MPVLPLDESTAGRALQFLDGISPRGMAHWRWKYGLTTPGQSAPRAFCWQEDGKVTGFIGLMPTHLHTGAGELPAAWFVDWHVAPGSTAVGVGLGLLRAAQRVAGMLVTLQGSAHTRRILPRLGWKSSAAPVSVLLPLSARYAGDVVARRVPLAAWVGSPAGQVARAWFRRRQPARFGGATLVDVARMPESYDTVWNARVPEFAPAMTRSSAHMNHLCADYPGGGYRLQMVHWRGATVGHVITRVHEDARGFRQGRLVDLLWPAGAPRLLGWLIDMACWQLDCDRADYVLCTASRADLRAELKRAGFVAHSSVPIWYPRLSADTPNPDQWHITYLDCDRAYR